MSFLDNLPTLNERTYKPGDLLKAGLPAPLAKKAKQKAKGDKDEAFRNAIWRLDRGRSRATGRKLQHSGLDWDGIGEVDHVINRSTAPDRVYDLSNGILLSKTENRLKKVRCLHAVEFFMFSIEGPDDRRKPQRFIWRDADGKVIKETRG